MTAYVIDPTGAPWISAGYDLVRSTGSLPGSFLSRLLDGSARRFSWWGIANWIAMADLSKSVPVALPDFREELGTTRALFGSLFLAKNVTNALLRMPETGWIRGVFAAPIRAPGKMLAEAVLFAAPSPFAIVARCRFDDETTDWHAHHGGDLPRPKMLYQTRGPR